MNNQPEWLRPGSIPGTGFPEFPVKKNKGRYKNMILRFENKKTKNCINIDTNREEQSEQRVTGKNYIEVDVAGFQKICDELDFNCYGFVENLTVDTPADPDPLPFC